MINDSDVLLGPEDRSIAAGPFHEVLRLGVWLGRMHEAIRNVASEAQFAIIIHAFKTRSTVFDTNSRYGDLLALCM